MKVPHLHIGSTSTRVPVEPQEDLFKVFLGFHRKPCFLAWIFSIAVWVTISCCARRCRGAARPAWRKPWSSSLSWWTTRFSCSRSSGRWSCSAPSPCVTAATWPRSSWRRYRGGWSTPPTSSNTCCRISSNATWRARTIPNCCCAGKPGVVSFVYLCKFYFF